MRWRTLILVGVALAALTFVGFYMFLQWVMAQ